MYELKIVEFKKDEAKAVVAEDSDFIIVAIFNDAKPYKVMETNGEIFEEYEKMEDAELSEFYPCIKELRKIVDIHLNENS